MAFIVLLVHIIPLVSKRVESIDYHSVYTEKAKAL